MDVLINWIGGILSQCVHTSSHHDVSQFCPLCHSKAEKEKRNMLA